MKSKVVGLLSGTTLSVVSLLSSLLFLSWRRRGRGRGRTLCGEQGGGEGVNREDLVVVIERCSDKRNWKHILQACVTLRLQEIWSIEPVTTKKFGGNNPVNLEGIEELEQCLKVKRFLGLKDFIAETKAHGYHIWATDLSQKACTLESALRKRRRALEEREEDPAKICLVFGREGDGVSKTVIEEAKERVYYPLSGFSDSLNLSASIAIIVDSILNKLI